MDEDEGESLSGLTVGAWRLEAKLGSGGTGAVYAAVHTLIGKQVAFKVLHKSLQEEAALRERFVREARAASALRHPAIVPVHDVLEAHGRTMLIMDRLDGESLEDKLVRVGSLEVAAAANILLPVVSALGALHAAGLVHRDVKSSNIQVTSDGTYLLDLGLVKADSPRFGPRLTRPGIAMGTPAFMSPEQSYASATDHRTDIWSLGLVFYEALTGRLPNQADSLEEILESIRRAKFEPIAQRAPGVPAPLAEVVDRMLRADPQRRPDSLEIVYDALAPHASAQVRATYPRPPPPSTSPEYASVRTEPAPLAVAAATAVTTGTGLAKDTSAPNEVAPTESMREPERAPAAGAPTWARQAAAGMAISVLLLGGALLWARARAPEPDGAAVAAGVPESAAPSVEDAVVLVPSAAPTVAADSTFQPEPSAQPHPSSAVSVAALSSVRPSVRAMTTAPAAKNALPRPTTSPVSPKSGDKKPWVTAGDR